MFFRLPFPFQEENKVPKPIILLSIDSQELRIGLGTLDLIVKQNVVDSRSRLVIDRLHHSRHPAILI